MAVIWVFTLLSIICSTQAGEPAATGSYGSSEGWTDVIDTPASAPAPAAARKGFELDGVRWEVHFDERYKQRYFYNTAANVSQWEDPRSGTPTPWRYSIALWLTPFTTLAAVLAARVWYLQAYYPELLWPTKERKTRMRKEKFKLRKPRGKMSQDGKGGRSANS